jgi:hypothetical protein
MTATSQFFLFSSLLAATFYLPLWFQATRGVTATKSGLNILPFMLSTVAGVGLGGGIISRTGRYWPFLFGSPLLLAVGAGLLFTINDTTPNARIIGTSTYSYVLWLLISLVGFQILYGVGLGGAMQNTVIAIQAEFADQKEMIPQATYVCLTSRALSPFLSVDAARSSASRSSSAASSAWRSPARRSRTSSRATCPPTWIPKSPWPSRTA